MPTVTLYGLDNCDTCRKARNWLKRFGVDPAVAGGVIVTTVTDVIGFASLLGLGTLVLR